MNHVVEFDYLIWYCLVDGFWWYEIVWLDSEEDRKWFAEAMQSQTVDVVKRLKEITQVLQTPQQVLEAHEVTPQDIEGSIWSSLLFS